MSRIAYVAYKFISEDMFYFGLFPIQTFGIFANFLRNYIIHALLLERIVATIFFRTYGQFDNKCPILAFCSIGISVIALIYFIGNIILQIYTDCFFLFTMFLPEWNSTLYWFFKYSFSFSIYSTDIVRICCEPDLFLNYCKIIIFTLF